MGVIARALSTFQLLKKVSVVRREQIRVLIKTAAQFAAVVG